jgi:hypothetical protein
VRTPLAALVAVLALAAAGCGGSGGGSGCTFRRPSAQDAQAIRTAIRRYDRAQTAIRRERILDIRISASDPKTAAASVAIVFPPAAGVDALLLKERGKWRVFAQGPNLLAEIQNQTQGMTEVLSDEGRLC